MSTFSELLTKNSGGISKVAIGVLAAIALFGVFVTGFDSGQLEQAFGMPSGMDSGNPGLMWLHEFTHDARHAAGFICH